MSLNPKKLVKKIILLLITLIILLVSGSFLFSIFVEIGLIFKILSIVLSLIICVFILFFVKRLYKQIESQFYELTLIHDISNSLNLTFEPDVLYRVNLYSIIERLHFNSGIIIGLENELGFLSVKNSVGIKNEYEKRCKKLKLPFDKLNNIIADAMITKKILTNYEAPVKLYKTNIGKLFGFSSYVVVPLINIDECVGALVLNSGKKIDINTHRNVINTSANYIATSLANIVLYNKLKRKLHENRKLNELAQKFNSELDLDKLMKLTIEASVELIGGERGNIFIYDPDANALVIKASVSNIPINPNIKFKIDEGIVGKVFLTGEPYLVNDTTKDTNFMNRPDSPRTIQSLLDVPIKTQDKTIGVLNIDNKIGGFNENDKDLLLTLSSHIGIAIENATLHKQLKKYSANLERLVKRRTWQLNKANNELERQNKLLADRNRIIENDLLMARAIQQQIVPNEVPAWRRINISSKYIPMDKVGGDFYDFLPIDNKRGIGFIISDVSGHGLASAFITAMIKIACNSLPTAILSRPQLFMGTVNERIIGYTSTNFITAFYAYFDLNEGTLCYACAGHNHPILFRKKTNEIIELYTKGRVLGFMEDAEFEQKEIKLEKDDRILFYTDGLSESINSDSDMYSEERVMQMLIQTSEKNVERAVEAIYLDMLDWVKDAEKITDDIAIVIFEYTG